MNAKAREQFAAGRQRLSRALAVLLEETGSRDPKGDAMSLFAEMLGALSLARVEPDAERSDAILASSIRSIKRRLGIEG